MSGKSWLEIFTPDLTKTIWRQNTVEKRCILVKNSPLTEQINTGNIMGIIYEADLNLGSCLKPVQI